MTCGVFDLPDLWGRIDSLDGGRADRGAELAAQRGAAAARPVDALVAADPRRDAGRPRGDRAVPAPRSPTCAGQIPELLVGVERERLDRRVADFVAAGAPADLAAEVAALLDVFSLLDIVEVSRRTGEDAGEVARLYFTISERYEVDRFLGRITACRVPTGGRRWPVRRCAATSTGRWRR